MDVPANDLFSLPLTNFEAALLADDRPAYPMTALYRLRFSGFLEPVAFKAAVEMVTRRHPLMRAVISRNRLGRPAWVAHANWQPNIRWQAQLNSGGWPHMTHIDPTQEAGFRWWVLACDDGHDVVIQGHHCATDGGGINTVIEELLISYAMIQGKHKGGLTLRLLDAQRLRRRGAPKLAADKSLKMALKQLRGLVGVHEFLGRAPTPLMGQHSTFVPSNSTPDDFPAIIACELDASETNQIRAAAKSLRVTLNVLLLCDLFLAIGEWRKKWGIGSSEDWLRVGVPMNLRGAADKAMPMANSISMIYLDRRAADFGDDSRLLRGIYEQLWLIKRFQLEYTYIFSLGVTQLVPGLMARMVQADKCQSSTYLSNLGIVLAQTQLPRQNGRLVCGNVVLETVDIGSILRPHTNAGFLTYIYAGKLRLTLQYDPRVMTAEQARELLAMVDWQIRQSILPK